MEEVQDRPICLYRQARTSPRCYVLTPGGLYGYTIPTSNAHNWCQHQWESIMDEKEVAQIIGKLARQLLNNSVK